MFNLPVMDLILHKNFQLLNHNTLSHLEKCIKTRLNDPNG